MHYSIINDSLHAVHYMPMTYFIIGSLHLLTPSPISLTHPPKLYL